MQSNPIHALLIDDSRMQYTMIRDFLSVSTQGTITLDWAFNYETGLAAIRANQHDVYLIDYQLDDRNGLELLTQAVAEGCTTPLILITGYSSRDIDLVAMQAGAADFLDKSDIKPSTLERSIRYATERAKIMAALRESEEVHRRLLGVTRQQARELMLLDKARTALADQLNLPEVIRTTVNLVTEAFGYSQASIYLYENDALTLQHQVGYATVIAQIPVNQGVCGRVFRTGEPVLLEDVRSDPAFLGAIDGIVSEICVPLFDHGQVTGVLNIESTNGVRLTVDDLRILTALGTHVGIIIGRARLYAEARHNAERYRLISELISDYAFSLKVNPDGTLEDEWFTYDAFTRMTGYTRPEVLARGRYSYYHPDDVAAVRAQVANALEGRLSAGEFRIITKSGDIRWLYLYRRPEWDEQQQRVVRVYGTAQDITARKQAEEALRQSEERYRTVVTTMAEGVVLHNKAGAIRACNASAEHILGLSADQLIGRESIDPRWHTIRPDGTPFPGEAHPAMITLATGQPQRDVEMGIYKTDGTLTWISVNTQPLVRPGETTPYAVIASFTDVTTRKQAEEALRQSEERYRIISEMISDYAYAYRVEPDGTLVREWVTDSYTRITGYAVGEIGRRGIFTLYALSDQARVAADMAAVLQGQPVHGEYQIITKQGEEHWIHIARQPVWDTQENRVVRFFGVAQDITERKRAEAAEREQRILAEALRDTAEALNSTLNFEEIVERILDNVGRVIPHDNASLMLFEGNYARVIRTTFPGLANGKDTSMDTVSVNNLRLDLSSVMPFLAEAGRTGQAIILADIWKLLPDELTGWLRANNQAIALHAYAGLPILAEGEMIGFLNLTSTIPGFFTANTAARLQAFSHQIATAIQNARRYEQAQELATLNERQRLARDLHDAVSQTLFSASVIAETIPHLWSDMPPHVRVAIGELHQLNRQALAEMRSLLLELRPRALIDTSMDELLEQLVETFTRRHGTPIALNVAAHPTLPPEAQVGLYRIAQEALNNIGKHAQAAQISLSLNHVGDGVTLCIQDNGRGFDPARVPANHFGIRIMYERAEAINAALVVDSSPGRGTSITVRWPAR
ncbi:MAG: PAS domain S-box protein [Anaerolineae bacterium]|nr:PAS domain S-box protein [Anaerolineae bacterium]